MERDKVQLLPSVVHQQQGFVLLQNEMFQRDILLHLSTSVHSILWNLPYHDELCFNEYTWLLWTLFKHGKSFIFVSSSRIQTCPVYFLITRFVLQGSDSSIFFASILSISYSLKAYMLIQVILKSQIDNFIKVI